MFTRGSFGCFDPFPYHPWTWWTTSEPVGDLLSLWSFTSFPCVPQLMRHDETDVGIFNSKGGKQWTLLDDREGESNKTYFQEGKHVISALCCALHAWHGEWLWNQAPSFQINLSWIRPFAQRNSCTGPCGNNVITLHIFKTELTGQPDSSFCYDSWKQKISIFERSSSSHLNQDVPRPSPAQTSPVVSPWEASLHCSL